MNRYTIYCTEAQTKKALELGAPILADTQEIKFAGLNGLPFDIDRVVIPTTEQMIGWLEEREIKITFILTSAYGPNGLTNGYTPVVNFKWNCETCYTSRKEAILVAIDAALEYLSKNKK